MMLDVSNIEILKYNEILERSRKMYREHLTYQTEAKLLPNLGTEVDSI